MIIGKYRNEKSLNGFSLDVLKSALQKYVRRGMTEKAHFFAGELDLFKNADSRQEVIRTNFLHRLMIIFLEDVGDMNIWNYIDERIFNLLNERNKPLTGNNRRDFLKEELWISQIIIKMCSSQKTRLPSHVRSLFGGSKYIDMAIKYYPSLAEYAINIKNFEESSKNIDTASLFKQLCSNFQMALNKKDIMAVYWAFKIVENDFKLSGRKKNPIYMVFNILEKTCSSNPQLSKYVILTIRWYEELKNTKEYFLPWVNMILLIIGKKNISKIPSNNDEKSILINWDVNRSCVNDKSKIPSIDNFVMDIHTRKRNSQMTSVDFALQGAIVIPENNNEVIPILKQFYEDTKRIDNNIQPYGKSASSSNVSSSKIEKNVKSENNENSKILTTENEVEMPSNYNRITHFNSQVEYTKNLIKKLKARKTQNIVEEKSKKENDKISENENINDHILRESQEFEFVVRTQLTTSHYKTDVYIGKKEGKIYIIKGPLPESSIRNHLKALELKKLNKLPVIPCCVVLMIPDRWTEGVPLGLRNNIDRSKPASFLIIKSLVKEEDLVYKMHKSKLWPDTRIVDWKEVARKKSIKHIDIKNINYDETRQYIESLCFRYILGIGDMADRNFIISEGIVYSIDEDGTTKNVVFMDELKKNKCEFISNWIKKNYDSLKIRDWKFDNELHNKRYKSILEKESLLVLFK